MSDLYKPQTLKLYAQQAGSVRLTLDWFANKAFYPPRAGVHIKPLINGQAAFDAVHAAMEAARQSIDIITWGFDPAMRFKRPDGPRIGELLQTKGREGVQARVLVWSNQLARLKENTIPGAGVGGSGGTWAGSGVASGSAVDNEVLRLEQRRQHNLNLIARQQEALERSERLHREGRLPSFDPRGAAHARARIAELEAENAEIQRTLDSSEAQGYGGKRGSGGTRQDPWGQIFTRDWFKAVRGGGLQNVEFRTRDFEQTARPVMNGEQVRLVNGRLQSLIHLLRADGIDDLGIGQLLVLTQFASHHQKMVLVDYGSPQAIGFVMGHNMHRNYWDTSAHLFDDRAAGRDPGFGPWQDISMQVQGPVLADLSRNFSEAWDLETPWYKRWFSTPSLTAERDALPLPKIATPASNSVAQICRTQPQDDERSILEHYLKALGNATDYVYMENQYFRYAGFAERLRKTAQVRKARGVPGDLYLFVVTNTPDSSDASKTTYDMMKGLGQEQLMPQVQRDLAHDLREKREQLKQVRENLHPDPYVRRGQENNIERLERKIEALEEKGVTPEVEQRLGDLGAQEIPGLAKNTGEDDKPYQLAEVPGLKVVVATLATSDPAPGSPPPARLSAEAEAALGAPLLKARYKHIYVHSKLLLVDDLYTLLSSANINVRSMHGDSELGIAQPNPDLARAMREELWGGRMLGGWPKRPKKTSNCGIRRWMITGRPRWQMSLLLRTCCASGMSLHPIVKILRWTERCESLLVYSFSC